MERVLRETRSVCPECLEELPAAYVARGDGSVWLERTCADHGFFEAYAWPDAGHFEAYSSLEFPQVAPLSRATAFERCPLSCGICAHHVRRPTLIEIELTQRCNLRCPVCFMSAGAADLEPTLEQLRGPFEAILAGGGPEGGVNLTGGEPTVRDDLPQVVALAHEVGLRSIEVNTNGVRIAREPGYLRELVDAGISGVYLQFDGVTPEPYLHTRGADLLDVKLAAIERCREAGVQVVLAMTIVGGVNEDQVGDVIRFALERNDVVAGVALQPAFTSGRFEAHRSVPLTMGDAIFALEAQTAGLIRREDVWPLGCSHPLCDAGTYLARRPGSDAASADVLERFVPVTRDLTVDEYRAAFNPASPQGSVLWDVAAARGLNPEGGLSVIIMDYMDRTNVDLARMEQCSMFSTMADGRLIPFCSYQLTRADGTRVHPPLGQ